MTLRSTPANSTKTSNPRQPTAATSSRWNPYTSTIPRPAKTCIRSSLALTPLSQAHSPILIENQYLTSAHSAKDPNVITHTIYMHLPRDFNHKATILLIIKKQLTQMQFVGPPTSPEGMDALQVEENSTYPVCPELDDEPKTSTTEVIPSQLRICP